MTDAAAEESNDLCFMRRALALAKRGIGRVSPNPAVGAVLTRHGTVLGEGWHRGPGFRHAEIVARDEALKKVRSLQGCTLYVTLEPCSTHGRTPPCTDAILNDGISRVVYAATDPNPAHRGRSKTLLESSRVQVDQGLLQSEAEAINPGFNHWIVQRRPLVTLKAAMTLDGKIASPTGESKWLTGLGARKNAMRLRYAHDAILVGIGTVLTDDPQLTVRDGPKLDKNIPRKCLRRFVLDKNARTPIDCRLCSDPYPDSTTVVVGPRVPRAKVERLRERVEVWRAPLESGRLSLNWLLDRMGKESITSLLVEGGAQVQGSFVTNGLVHRIAFYYAPIILGGADSVKAIGGDRLRNALPLTALHDLRWKKIGEDLLLTASVAPADGSSPNPDRPPQ